MDNMVVCKVCQKEFENGGVLHRHIKAHELLLGEYHQKYNPRFDKFSGELIHWTTLEHYRKTDFNSRDNFRLWLEKVDLSTAREYVRKKLIERKESKGLIWTPTQVELRTSMLPPVSWMDRAFEDYYGFCESLGFKNKLEKFLGWGETIKLDKRRKIFTDSREQAPLRFDNVKTEIKGLKYGDYSFGNSKWSGNIVIERKGVSDFVGTLSAGYERFQREIERAASDGAYLIVIVEELLGKVVEFNKLPYLSKKIHATPSFIFHRVRELLQKHPHIQFLFVRDHEDTVRATERLFEVGESAKKYDIQALFDAGLMYNKETL